MAHNPIVVGVVDTAESRRGVQLAARIAEAAEAELVAVHAVPDLWMAGGIDEMPPLLPQVRETLIRDAREHIEGVLAREVRPGVRHRLEVRIGAAGVALADVAHERGAELVVLGGRPHGALARGLGLSTAHFLVRRLDVPLVVAGESTAGIARVLVAVDISNAAIPAIRAAERLAGLLGAQLRILHVIEPLQLVYFPVATLDQRGLDQRSREAFARLLARLPVRVPEQHVVRTGSSAETITEEVKTWGADLLVVGSHGKGWVDRMLVGSTTERLLNVLPTSLVVIPTGGSVATAVAPRAKARKPETTPRRPRARRA